MTRSQWVALGLGIVAAVGMGFPNGEARAGGASIHGGPTPVNPIKRTNFIFIVADELGCEDCAPYGNRNVKTPTLERLAKEGMRFDAAFLTCSSSGPSKASMLTGRYPHATGASERNMALPPDQVLLPQVLRDAGYYTAAAGRWHLGPAAKMKFDLVKEGGRAGGYSDWIALLRDRPKNKPFLLWLGASDPRRPFTGESIREPHIRKDAVVPPYLPDVDEVREDLAKYYDEIARIDLNVGVVLAELDKQGIAEHTCLIFLSDCGRAFPRCKNTVLDSGLRMPLLVRWPNGVKPGTMCAGLVSAVDLAPTVVELAGGKPLAAFQGVSVAALLHDPQAASPRQFAFAEHNWHDYMAFERGVRGPRYAFLRNELPDLPRTPASDVVRSVTFQTMRRLRDEGKLAPPQRDCFAQPRPREELYDVQQDPNELHNRCDDPQLAGPLQELRQALDEWQQQTGDVRPRDLTPDAYDRETGMGLRAKKDLATTYKRKPTKGTAVADEAQAPRSQR